MLWILLTWDFRILSEHPNSLRKQIEEWNVSDDEWVIWHFEMFIRCIFIKEIGWMVASHLDISRLVMIVFVHFRCCINEWTTFIGLYNHWGQGRVLSLEDGSGSSNKFWALLIILGKCDFRILVVLQILYKYG